ncbi:hypothetical protein BST81_03440 [Leptolyngbya sp. 'hensonii']|uniref:hypothetical protein n=1 Tax=Leptolyngbya sp. 'hensonii' TaxID=1922337 RepID=UPI00094FA347|nr:hypothetical protein [Leptolyngbya sp. 'hensonii']OLP19840.1 hypothetical protein BST81_03440 [Leptolyngbya sp. 'hensonii']
MRQNINLEAGNGAYGQRTAEDYIKQMDPNILTQLEPSQLEEIRRLLREAIPRPSPKIVDLRFVVDLLFSRFYIVLFVGKDRRRKLRKPSLLDPITYVGNLVSVIILLIGFNLTVSATLLLVLYLLKSLLGIDFSPEHFPDALHRLIK